MEIAQATAATYGKNVQSNLPLRLLVLVAIGLLIYFFLAVPNPIFLVSSPDTGVQTAGGQQIAMGEQPFADWRSTYGPLRFYLSYLAARIGGGRVGAELGLCTLGNTLTYLLLFCCAQRLSQRTSLAVLVTAIAAVLMPPFIKFYIALCPLLALMQAYRFLEAPSKTRLACMAGTIVVAACYRMDVGLWAIVPCIVAIGLASKEWWRSLSLLFGFVLAIAAPWWLYLLHRGALWEYVLESTYYGIGLAKGLELPYPRFNAALGWHADGNLAALSFAGVYVASALVAAIMVWRRRELASLTRRYLAVTVPLAASALLQTMHRSDYSHLRQGSTGLYLLLAVLLSLVCADAGGMRSKAAKWPARIMTLVVACFALVALALPIAWGATTGQLQLPTVQRLNDWVTLYDKRPDAFLAKTRERYPENSMVAVAIRLRQILPAGTRLFAAPYLTNLYTMSEHPFAARQLYLAPGYFNDRDGQWRMIRSLIEQDCPPILEQIHGGYDGLPSRTSRAIAPLFFDFVDAHYAPDPDAALPASFMLWRHRGSPPTNGPAADHMDCPYDNEPVVERRH